MQKRIIVIVAGVLGIFAALTAVASATLIMGYQPRLPKSLQ